MKSLKRQLALWNALGAIALSTAAGIGIYFLTASFLTAEFDASLTRKARLLASSIELDHDELEFGFEELDTSEFISREAGGYLQVFLEDGRSVFRSRSLAGLDLPISPVSDDFSVAHTIRLPGGHVGRYVVSRVRPVVDEEGQASPPLVVLCVVRDMYEIQQALSVLRLVLIGVGAILAVSMVLLTYFAVGRGLRPVNELARRVEAIDESTLDQPIDPPGLPSELTPIVEQFNGLMSRLDFAFERERRFSSNIAHELRTPLAGLRTTIEVARSQHRSPEEHQRYLQQLNRIALQMQAMTEGLLHLSRLEQGLVSPATEQVDLDQLLRDIWQSLVRESTGKKFEVQFDLEIGRTVMTDPALLSILLRNVLQNALTNVNEGGKITIRSCVRDSQIELTLANTGSHISAEDIEKVFDRFWRADAARTQTGTHFGLGLPLTRRAIEAMDGQITAKIQEPDIFVVSITLPC